MKTYQGHKDYYKEIAKDEKKVKAMYRALHSIGFGECLPPTDEPDSLEKASEALIARAVNTVRFVNDCEELI